MKNDIPYLDDYNWPFSFGDEYYYLFPPDIWFINRFGEFVEMNTVSLEDAKLIAKDRIVLEVEYDIP